MSAAMPRRLHALVAATAQALVFACQPPGVNDAAQAAIADDGLPGVDTNSLTRTERDVWAELVTEQLAPCGSVTQNVADCVRHSAACQTCKPAAQLMAQQIRRGKTKKQAEKAFRLRFADNAVASVDLDGSPTKGPENAVITIVEWADFECGFCARAVPVLEEAHKAYPDRVRLVFKHFPLDSHVRSTKLAKLAIAAGEQGQFWQMHAALFGGKGGALDDEAIRALAVEMKLDPDRLLSDMQSPRVAERIARDRAQADKLGLKGTPFILVNLRHFDFDVFSLEEDLRPWLDVELELRAATSKAP